VAIRGGRDWCTQANMARAEQQDLPYLFKLRMTTGVKKIVERLMRGAQCSDAGQTRHSGQTRITISHPHAEVAWVEGACREIAAFFKTLRQTAEQLTPLQRWYRVLSRALVEYLNGQELRPPPCLPAPV
jgi:hypothetical protein